MHLGGRNNETEPIYEDEVNDGIAHAAKEQAEAWQAAADEDGIESIFVRELVALTTKEMGKRNTSRAGEFGTQSRLQPRYQKNRAASYDAVCAERVHGEKAATAKQRQAAAAAQAEAEREERERLNRLGLKSEEPCVDVSLHALAGATDDEDQEFPALVLAHN